MNNIKFFIKKNKKLILIYLLFIITINLLLNHNFVLSLFNKTKPIIYNNEQLKLLYNSYELVDINKEINLIEINFKKIPQKISIDFTNKDFKNYNHHNSSYTNDNIKNEKIYIPTSINSKTKNLKFYVTEGIVDSIILNPKVKFNPNIFLNIIISAITFFIYYLLKNNNKIMKRNFSQTYCTIIAFTIIISICIGFYLGHLKSYSFGNFYEFQYILSLREGKLELNDIVTNELLNAENPYDTSNRYYSFSWDLSYYKGKYYCYFGIWPALSLLLPYHLLTNKFLTTPLACLFYCILGVIGTFLLYNNIIKKYFKKINYETYIISFIFIIFGSKLLWCMHRPSFYELVALAAYAHVMFGLNLTLFSDNKIKNFIGYLLLALSVLCRPTALFCSILLIPKLLNRIKHKNFKILDFILLAIPYAIVGIFTMYINYIRFDSIFEFGISYQLTTNNLNNYKFSIINSLYGTFIYLFDSFNISLIPFKLTSNINKIPIVTDFYIEKTGGGTITTSLIGLIILFTPKILKYIKEKELKIYITLSLILGTILTLFSSGIGALIGRYMLDFNYIFYFIIVILSLIIINKHENKKLTTIYKILTIISIFINFMLATTNY